jgi:cobalamin-dependent methionine synthase I
MFLFLSSFLEKKKTNGLCDKSLSVTCGRSVVSSTNKTDRHDITEILLKVALNTKTNQQTNGYRIRNVSMFKCSKLLGEKKNYFFLHPY